MRRSTVQMILPFQLSVSLCTFDLLATLAPQQIRIDPISVILHRQYWLAKGENCYCIVQKDCLSGIDKFISNSYFQICKNVNTIYKHNYFKNKHIYNNQSY